jgi:hypothetical protein
MNPYKRSHLVALRPTKISASDPPSGGANGFSRATQINNCRTVTRVKSWTVCVLICPAGRGLRSHALAYQIAQGTCVALELTRPHGRDTFSAHDYEQPSVLVG